MVVAVGMLLSQVFALGHLAFFTHTRCEHGALVHGQAHVWQREAQPKTPSDGKARIAPSEGREPDHDHCDSLATPPALAFVKSAPADASCVEALPARGVRARAAERSVAILSLAPKTSPTA
jgi:hypothetical protein